MKLRKIECPTDLRWMGVVMTPADLQAFATARQVVEGAKVRARQIEAAAQASVSDVQRQARDAFLAQYGKVFHDAVRQWNDARQDLQLRLSDYARQVAQATLQRLGTELSSSQRLEVVIRQLISETLPDGAVTVHVAPESLNTARSVLQGGKSPAFDEATVQTVAQVSGAIDDLASGFSKYRLVPDASLQSDEVLVVGPQGASIRCSFEQMVHQLLLCL